MTITIKEYRPFKVGLESGAFHFYINPNLDIDIVRMIAIKSGMRIKRDITAFIKGFQLASNEVYASEWKQGKDLLYFSKMSNDIIAIKWDYEWNGHCNYIEHV